MAGEKRVKWEMYLEENVTETLDRIMTKVSVADSVFSKLGGVMATILGGLSLAALIETTKSIIEAGDAAVKTSQKLGIGVEALQELEYAAKLSNLSAEALQKGLKGLSQRALEAADGGAAAQDMFKRLGVDVLDATGKMKPTEQLLLDLAARFQTMPDGVEKTAAATKLFGKAGLELIPFLNQGRDGLEDLMKEAERLGIVMDAKTAVAAEALNDNMMRLSASTRGMMIQAIAPLIPFLTQMSDEMVKAKTSGDGVQHMSEAITTGLRLAGTVILTVKAALEQLGNTIGAIAAATVASFSGEFKREQEIWKQVDKDNMGVRDRLGKDLDGLWNGVEQGAMKASTAVKELGKSTLETGNLLKEWIALRDKLDSKDGGKAFEVDPSFAKDYQLLNTVLKAHIITFKEYEAELGKLMDRQPFMKAARDEEKKQWEDIAAAERALSDAYMASKKSADDLIGSIRNGNKDIDLEISLIGKTTLERDLATLSRAKEKDMLKAVTPEQRKVVDELYAERDARVRIRDGLQDSLDSERTFWTQIGGYVDGLAHSLVDGVGGAVDYLKKQFKSLLADMLAIFAKRWLLSMIAGVTGGGGIGSAAASAGMNVGAGTVASGVLGATGLSGFGEGISMGFQSGVAAPGAFGEAIGAFMATPAGWVVAGVAAIAALAYSFRDKGENWQATLGFGSNARAYTTQGVFGPEGFQSIQGNDSLNQQIQAFMAGTRPIDQQLASGLSPAQIAAITTSLGGAYTHRNDGQPSQFAFGQGDDTAGQQLTLEYLQKKYGTIFDTIDTQFASFIRGYTGKAEDLLTAIGGYASVFEAIQKINIKGLSVQSLQAWQAAGETLPQTLQRVLGAFSAFDSAFMSDAQKLTSAQNAVTSVFHDLGIAIPESSAAFYDLVHSIDISTEAGRHMVEQLFAVAPAFQTVEQAAANAVATFNSIAGQLSPNFGSANARSVLESAVNSWRGLGNNSGRSTEQTISDIANLISSGQIGSALTYAQGLGGNAVNVLNAMLQAYQAWQQSMNSGATTIATIIPPLNTAITNLGTAATTAASALSQQQDGIAQWLQQLMLDKTLSPLTPQQRVDYARDTYVENLLKAQSGDVGALSQYTSLATSYLTELQSFLGPGSQYLSAFTGVASQGAGLAGLSDARPVTAADTNRGFQSVVDAIQDLKRTVGQQAAALDASTKALDRANQQNATMVAEALRDGAPTFR